MPAAPGVGSLEGDRERGGVLGPRDRTGDTLRRVAPVLLHCGARGLPIAALDRVNDLRVLRDGRGDAAVRRGAVQPPVALGLRLDRVMQGAEPGAGGGFHVSEVETGKEFEDFRGVDGDAGGGLEERFVEPAQLGGEPRAFPLRQRGRLARAEPFDGADQLEELPGIFEGQGRYAQATPVSTLDRYVPFPRQDPERTPDRSTAESEALREVGLDQPRARGQAPGDDQLTKLCIRSRDTLFGHADRGSRSVCIQTSETGQRYHARGGKRKNYV